MQRQDGTSLSHRHTAVTEGRAPKAPPPAPLQSLASDCSRVSQVLSRIGDKWTILIVMLLRHGPRRFSELKREIGGVSQRMLTLTLRGLERDGLVERTVYATTPPRVDYALTPLGHSLREPAESLGDWAFAYLDAIERARQAFDDRAGADAAGAGRGGARVVRMETRPSARRTKSGD
jgi:DNA-binding HxlR family transcriptional regulator